MTARVENLINPAREGILLAAAQPTCTAQPFRSGRSPRALSMLLKVRKTRSFPWLGRSSFEKIWC